MTPKVSIIVPNYNHAPYLRQRLDSIFNQTYQDFEVIILDDCSTDNSKEIIEEYRNCPQVSHVIYNETNSGSPFKQWAKGFYLSKGEYIWIAESDDWAELNFLAEMVPILEQDPSLSLTFCNSFNERDGFQSTTQNSFDSTVKISSSVALKRYMCWGCTVYNASSVLFRKKILKEIPNNYQNYCSSGDYLFWIYLVEKGNLHYYYKPLNHYRIHEYNKSITEHISGKAFYEDLKIFHYKKGKGYLSFYKKHAIVLNNVKYIDKQMSICPQNKILQSAKKLWEKEVFSVSFSIFVVKLGELIWNFFIKRHEK